MVVHIMTTKRFCLIFTILWGIFIIFPPSSSAQLLGGLGKKRSAPKPATIPPKEVRIQPEPQTETPLALGDSVLLEAHASAQPVTELKINGPVILNTSMEAPAPPIQIIPEVQPIPPAAEKTVSVNFVEDKKLPPPQVETYPMRVPAQPAVETAAPKMAEPSNDLASAGEYGIGVDDLLEISVLKPEELNTLATVAPDGTITFPYIGTIQVRGRSINQVQYEIQQRLSDGFMKYPVVIVSLKESRSRKFFVYGEVIKPGSYPMEDNMTVLRAISTAGGFTRFGSSSRVKVLRPRKGAPGYDSIKVNINAVMDGNPTEDIQLSQGDIVVISQGVF